MSAPTSWRDARRLAWSAGAVAGRRRESVSVAIEYADGLRLACDVHALVDLPSADASAMDGWAVAGAGPWRVGAPVRMGSAPGGALRRGAARPITTGAPVPAGTEAVLRQEDGEVAFGRILSVRPGGTPPALGADIRLRAEELAVGALLLPRGRRLSPVSLALAASAGVDQVEVAPPPRVDLIVTGDEVLTRGAPTPGRVRDAFGPSLPAFLRRLGAGEVRLQRVADDRDALARAIASSTAHLIVTTGGTAAGRTDHLRDAIGVVGGELVFAGVAMRPGHPVLLATRPDGTPVLGLPGNPLAAFACLLSFAPPLLDGIAGTPMAEPPPCADAGIGRRADTTLLRPVRMAGGVPTPTGSHGSAMLAGLAVADALVVVPPDGVARWLAVPGADPSVQLASSAVSSRSA